MLYLSGFLKSFSSSDREKVIRFLAKNAGVIGILESYALLPKELSKVKVMVAEIKEKFPQVSIFVDSGAFTWYCQNVKKGQYGKSDYAWVQSEKFKRFFENYMKVLKEIEEYVDAYAVLDVIGSYELTLENWKVMRKNGLNPLPVLHFGSSVQAIEPYCMDGTKYIALGGLAVNSDFVVEVWAEKIVKVIKERGIMVHGFGVSPMRKVACIFDTIDTALWIQDAGRRRLLWERCNGIEKIELKMKGIGNDQLSKFIVRMMYDKESSARFLDIFREALECFGRSDRVNNLKEAIELLVNDKTLQNVLALFNAFSLLQYWNKMKLGGEACKSNF